MRSSNHIIASGEMPQNRSFGLRLRMTHLTVPDTPDKARMLSGQVCGMTGAAGWQVLRDASEQILRLEPTLYVNCYPSQSDGQFIIRMTPSLRLFP